MFDLKSCLKTLGMTQLECAELFDLSPRIVRNYAANDYRIPLSLQIVLDLMARGAVRRTDIINIKKRIER